MRPIAVAIVFFTLCYVVGYLVGSNQNFYEKIDLSETEIYLYADNTMLFSKETLDILAKMSGLKLILNQKERDQCDLIFSTNIEAQSKKDIFKIEKISPDFIKPEYANNNLIPILWRILDDSKLEILFLQPSKTSEKKRRPLVRFFKSLISDDFQNLWIPRIPWNTTVILKKSFITDTKKAESIRTINLKNLKIRH